MSVGNCSSAASPEFKMAEDANDTVSSPGVGYACPRCHSPIGLAAEGARCSACGFKAVLRDGIYCFSDGNSEDGWWKTFEDLASGPIGDTSAAVEYRSPLQQNYVVRGLRRACSATPEKARILDIGCGNGILWKALFPNRPAIGIDYSLGMCVLARGRGMLAHQADALALPFADAQFDLVYSAEMLQYIGDLHALFAEFSRVCRPNGRILVSTGNRTSLARKAFHLLRKLRPHPVGAGNRNIILRTAEEIVIATRGLPLKLETACWTHFPLSWVRCRASAHNPLDSLATNAILCFVKS
jgi:SAM-dependent methyltransferase